MTIGEEFSLLRSWLRYRCNKNSLTGAGEMDLMTHGGVCLSLVAQSCPTLCDPMDCSLPGSSVHGIFQARVLEWIAISFSIIFHFHAWEAWWAAVYGVAQSRTWLKWLSLAAMVLSSFPGGLASKKSTCNVGDLDLIPGLGRCPGGRHSNYNILDWRIPMDRGAWQATVHGIAKSHTWLSD